MDGWVLENTHTKTQVWFSNWKLNHSLRRLILYPIKTAVCILLRFFWNYNFTSLIRGDFLAHPSSWKLKLCLERSYLNQTKLQITIVTRSISFIKEECQWRREKERRYAGNYREKSIFCIFKSNLLIWYVKAMLCCWQIRNIDKVGRNCIDVTQYRHHGKGRAELSLKHKNKILKIHLFFV